MRAKLSESLEIPAGVSCEFANKTVKCKKDSVELSRKVDVPTISVKVAGNAISFECASGNKKNYKIIKSQIAHMKNMFQGLEKEYVYHLESCNVHFPMTLKLEAGKLMINNFLGEKTPRVAKILPGVKVDIKGAKITVSSHDKEAAGQTAANLERATKIRNRDRRIFQDGIFLIDRPGGAK
jgi:large subunit ribosomal protein L6